MNDLLVADDACQTIYDGGDYTQLDATASLDYDNTTKSLAVRCDYGYTFGDDRTFARLQCDCTTTAASWQEQVQAIGSCVGTCLATTKK